MSESGEGTGKDGDGSYQALVVLAYLPMVGVRDAEERKQPERIGLFRAFARQWLKTLLGASPETMAFTETGLAFK